MPEIIAPPAPVPTPGATPAPAKGPDQVPAASIPAPVTPTPPKPGSAKSRVFADLQKVAKTEPVESPESPASNTPETPPPGSTPNSPEPKPDAAPSGAPKAAGAGEPPPPDGKRQSPWKLVDQFKERAVKAETELNEVRKLIPNEAEAKSRQERLEKSEARVQELESHLRHIDYQASEEFKTKYQQPYEDAWGRAARELKEIPLKDPLTNQLREAVPQDLLELVNLPLGQARALAKEMFGEFADDAMGWRKTIRDLFDQQQAALEDAKKNGAKWQQEQLEALKDRTGKINTSVTEMWERAKAEVLNHAELSKYLKPVEGDKENNDRLEKAYKMVDEAFSVNPLDPRLTPEQRSRAVQLHSALRHRAVAFGPLLYQLKRAVKQLNEANEKLKGYETSTPPTTPTPAGQTTPGAPKGWARLQGELQKLARPGAA